MISMHSSSCFLIAISLLLLPLFPHTHSDPRISEAGLLCGTVTAPSKSNYISTFVTEMESLSKNITSNNWASHSVISSSSIPIFALAHCFRDLSHTDCLLCYAASRTRLPRCLPAVSARIYLDGCFLRYDNYSFYSEATDSARDRVNCSSKYGEVRDGGERWEHEKSVKEVVEKVVKVSVREGGFGVGEVGGVYALAQCWNSVGSDGCRDCLEKAGKEVRGCLPKREGRALNAGCYLRYSTEKFYNEGGEVHEEEDGNGECVRISS